MSTTILMCALFFAKVIDNALSTTKTILVQRNHCILAGIALAASNFIYLCITKNVVNSDSSLALIVVSVASGIGCCLAVAVSSRLSKEKTYSCILHRYVSVLQILLSHETVCFCFSHRSMLSFPFHSYGISLFYCYLSFGSLYFENEAAMPKRTQPHCSINGVCRAEILT